MTVETKHSEYTNNIRRWQTVRDCVAGSNVVKEAGDMYLPRPNANDNSDENRRRYDAYRQRAQFVNFAARTKNGLVGSVFRKPITIDIPEQLSYLEENANGAFLTLEQITKDIIGDVLETGNYGILIDAPAHSNDALTKRDMKNSGFGAFLKCYPAESIINWKTDGSKTTMVVLRETVDITPDDFVHTPVVQYRELKLQDGIYIQRLWVDGDIVAEFEPRKSDGSAFDEIPFVKVGAVSNDMTTDTAPLYDIAEINIGHYRNSADYEESCFIVGQPTPWISGLDDHWVSEHMKNGVMLGSRSAVLLPENGAMGLVQAGENAQPIEAMRLKEEQLIKIGARIISDSRAVETAEAARIRFSSENSVLSNIVDNVSAAIYSAMQYVGEFMGIEVTEDNTLFEINKEFFDQTIDPQLITSSILLLDRGVISKEDIRSRLRKTNYIDADRTDDDIENDVEVMNPVA